MRLSRLSSNATHPMHSSVSPLHSPLPLACLLRCWQSERRAHSLTHTHAITDIDGKWIAIWSLFFVCCDKFNVVLPFVNSENVIRRIFVVVHFFFLLCFLFSFFFFLLQLCVCVLCVFTIAWNCLLKVSKFFENVTIKQITKTFWNTCKCIKMHNRYIVVVGYRDSNMTINILVATTCYWNTLFALCINKRIVLIYIIIVVTVVAYCPKWGINIICILFQNRQTIAKCYYNLVKCYLV